MVEMNPRVQAILDEYNVRRSGNVTVTQNNPEIFQAAERIVTTQQVSYSQGPEVRTSYHTENVKRSGVPSQHISEGYVGSSALMSREEWLARNPDKQPVMSITHEEWLARQGNRPVEVETISHGEWRGPAMESISHEEWLRRQAFNNNEVRVSGYREENVKRSGNIGDVTYVNREVKPQIESISYDEWMRRQALNNNEVRVSEYREENVKRSGNIGEVTYVSGGVIPYDYRDFRPKDFTYEYREQRPVQYETVYERSPVNRVIYEDQRPVNVTVQQNQPPQNIEIKEVREERTKQKKPPVVFEGERKPSGWCC